MSPLGQQCSGPAAPLGKAVSPAGGGDSFEVYRITFFILMKVTSDNTFLKTESVAAQHCRVSPDTQEAAISGPPRPGV